MQTMKLCRDVLIRLLVVVVIISSCYTLPAFSEESEDSQIFITGFNAFQQKNYSVTIDKMNEVLQKYPDTPLRDMVLFWLSRAYFKSGNQQEAARFMSQFSREYPDNPLKGTIDEELLVLTARYEKGEMLPTAPPDTSQAVIARSGSEKSRKTQEKTAREKAERERQAAAEAEAQQAAHKAAEAQRVAAEQAEKARQSQKLADERAAAARKAEEERLAAAKAEAARIAAAKAEADRQAREQALAAKRAQEAAEQLRLAALKAEEERKAAEKAEQARKEQERVAAEIARKAEEERQALEQALAAKRAQESAERQRLAALKAEEERKAAEKTEQARKEQERVARLAQERERLATLAKEQERQAAAKTEAERQAREQALAAKRAQETAEQQKLAAFKAEEERKAAERQRIEQEQREKSEHDALVKQQAELLRQALEKAEKKRLAAEQEEKERQAADEAQRAAKAEKKRLAALEVEKERAEAARIAAARAEEERRIAEKAEQARIERDKLEKERAAAVAAEAARLAEVRREQERKALEKAEADRKAAEQAALAKKAAIEAEQKRLAQAKADQERRAAELAEKERLTAEAARKEAAARQVSAKVEQPVPLPVTKSAAADEAAAKSALREKAIEQYKSILVSYPQSQAAVAAAAKLKELGVAVAVPTSQSQTLTEQIPENTQVLRFEVAQFAGLEFNLLPQAPSYNASQRVAIPFVITNQGNGSDSYYLESGFPTEFAVGFSAAATPTQGINQTPALAPGESFKGFINLTIPATSIDGLRIAHPVKASSRTATEATQTREVRLVAAAPLLRATVRSDRANPLPGERITYRVALLNVGSVAAQDVSFRLNYPPQLEPVDSAAAGFRQEMKGALVLDGVQLKSGESKEFGLSFLLREGALAGEEIITRAELTNNQLKTLSSFVSTPAYVQPQHGVLVAARSDRLVVIPGQTVSVPFAVTNTGNVREKFTLTPLAKPGQTVTTYHDLNRDGIRQATEPAITEIGPLAAKEEVSIIMEVATSRSATDGSDEVARLSIRPAGEGQRSFEGATRLVYSRPQLQLAMSGKDARLKPGEVVSYDLVVTNRGSNIARIVELKSIWPEQLELVAADPSNASSGNGALLWNFKELGAGEKRVIKVSLRVKPGTGVGTNIQVRNTLTYEDQIGNRY